MTEERVTKRVIRRRAAAPVPEPTPPPPPTIEEPLPPPAVEAEALAVAPAEAEQVVEEPRSAPQPEVPTESPEPQPVAATPEEPIAEASPPPSPAEPEAPAKPETVEENPYIEKYKRIKVVSAVPPPATLGPRLVSAAPPPPATPRSVDSLLANPGAAGLGRKEIIEIRDYNRLKGMGSRKKRLAPGKKGKKTEITVPRAAKRVVRISDSVAVSELARRMSVKVGEVIARLMGMGTMVTIHQQIDVDTATLVASEFGFALENVAMAPDDLLLEQEKEESARPEDLEIRPPVVTVMGHVDHGKTSLLDAIRKTDVAAGEAGGITQHIGAYSVKTESGRQITFIDTPGHEAFTAMRARGAKVTDLVILVVAADDGVMPQTKEAVNHAQNAGVPILVAVNKMDKPGANPEKIKKALTEFKMVPEEWGGDTIYVPVSAKTGLGVPELLEYVLLRADVLELKATPKRLAKGFVIEAELDKRRGSVMTVVVQNGTLKEGDFFVVGSEVGRVRAMRDDKGARVREAGPSEAVEVMGLSGVVSAGDTFSVVADEKKAKQISELRKAAQKEAEMAKTAKVSLSDLYQKIEMGDVKELKVVVKADTSGSVEALSEALVKLSTPKVSVKVIHGAVGGVSENDVMLAKASGAVIVAFHIRPDSAMTALAEQQKVEIRAYDIIYELTEELTKAMAGLLAPKKVETVIGHAEVRQVFSIPKAGNIAGCSVSDGKILRSSHVRLIRDSVPIYTGALKSLRRFKDDAREVTMGQECGIAIENFNDIKVGDVIEAFSVEEVTASLT
jgi:translation initiation factor IF-2